MPSDFEIMLNPDKYGYVVCEHCNGYGSSLKEESDRCTKCGGKGIVKDVTNNHTGEELLFLKGVRYD